MWSQADTPPILASNSEPLLTPIPLPREQKYVMKGHLIPTPTNSKSKKPGPSAARRWCWRNVACGPPGWTPSRPKKLWYPLVHDLTTVTISPFINCKSRGKKHMYPSLNSARLYVVISSTTENWLVASATKLNMDGELPARTSSLDRFPALNVISSSTVSVIYPRAFGSSYASIAERTTHADVSIGLGFLHVKSKPPENTCTPPPVEHESADSVTGALSQGLGPWVVSPSV